MYYSGCVSIYSQSICTFSIDINLCDISIVIYATLYHVVLLVTHEMKLILCVRFSFKETKNRIQIVHKWMNECCDPQQYIILTVWRRMLNPTAMCSKCDMHLPSSIKIIHYLYCRIYNQVIGMYVRFYWSLLVLTNYCWQFFLFLLLFNFVVRFHRFYFFVFIIGSTYIYYLWYMKFY